jgi:hypothetical protein
MDRLPLLDVAPPAAFVLEERKIGKLRTLANRSISAMLRSRFNDAIEFWNKLPSFSSVVVAVGASLADEHSNHSGSRNSLCPLRFNELFMMHTKKKSKQQATVIITNQTLVYQNFVLRSKIDQLTNQRVAPVEQNFIKGPTDLPIGDQRRGHCITA